MSDLRNKLIKFAYNHPQYRKDILPLVKSGGTDKVASQSLIEGLLPQRDVISCIRKIKKTDEQSSNLLRDAYLELSDQLDITDNQRYALNRMKNVVENCDRMQPAGIRNQVFKAADMLGMRLPSGIFASQKTASLKKFQKKCNIYYRKHLTINFVGVTGEGSASAREISEGCQAFELEVMKVFSRLGINTGKDECEVNANRGFTFAMTKVFDGRQVQDLLTSAVIRNRADDGDLGSIDDLVKLLESQGWACTVR